MIGAMRKSEKLKEGGRKMSLLGQLLGGSFGDWAEQIFRQQDMTPRALFSQRRDIDPYSMEFARRAKEIKNNGKNLDRHGCC